MAAITSYTTLQTAVEDYLWTTAYTAFTADFIQAAHRDIFYGIDDPQYRLNPLRIRPMEAQIQLVLRATLADTTSGGSAGGSANAITITTTSALTSLLTGHRFTFKAGATNTGSTTLAVDSVAAVTIRKYNEGSVVALDAGDITNGLTIEVYYDGTQFVLCPHGGVALPSRFLEKRRLYINDNVAQVVSQPEFMPPENFYGRYMTTLSAKPRAYTIEGEFFAFAPTPDTLYGVRFLYYRKFAALSAGSDTNWIIDNHANTYLWGALYHAALYAGEEERIAQFFPLFRGAVHGLNKQDRADRLAAPLIARSNVRVY